MADGVSLVESWTWLATMAAAGLAALCAWCWTAPALTVGGELYRKDVETAPSGTEVSLSVFQTPGWLMASLGGATAALGIKMLVESHIKGVSLALPFSATGWLTILIGILLIGFRYAATLDASSGRLTRSFQWMGIGPTFRRYLSPDARVRLRHEISVLPSKSGSPGTSHTYYLQVVESDLVTPLSSSANPEAASQLAAHLQQDRYELLVCDHTHKNAPDDVPRLEVAPRERVSSTLPKLALLAAVLVMAVPFSYSKALQAERQTVSENQSAYSGNFSESLRLLKLEDSHANGTDPSSQAALADYQKALEGWNVLLENDPNNSMAVLGRGRVQIRLGQLKEGLADVDRFRELEPQMWAMMGRSRSQQHSLPPDLLADAYLRTGNAALALFILERDQFSDPALKGLALVELGRREEAEEILDFPDTRRTAAPEYLSKLEERLRQP